jgi:hypothetical protein
MGRFKDRTRPAPGNHEYHSDGASSYVRYFGALAGDPKKGYYSYDLADWHVIVLNSQCAEVGGCGAGSTQEQWLRMDLKAHPAKCTLAYWHSPYQRRRCIRDVGLLPAAASQKTRLFRLRPPRFRRPTIPRSCCGSALSKTLTGEKSPFDSNYDRFHEPQVWAESKEFEI